MIFSRFFYQPRYNRMVKLIAYDPTPQGDDQSGNRKEEGLKMI